jgi:hypothetical protein
MTSDARFEEGVERPVRLIARTEEDLEVISALVQDAVGQTGEVSWMPKRRRFGMLLNRFRWEDAEIARRQGRDFERVRTLLTFDSVLRVRASGLDPTDPDVVLSLLAVAFEGASDGSGTVRLVLAGDGEIALDVECVDATLTDVSRPYVAPSGHLPRHPAD